MSAEPRPLVGAVILAAGASARLGQPKQLLPVGGRPLLQRTIEAALGVPGLWPIVVVLGAHREPVRALAARFPVLLADNPAWAEGMASSLRVGLSTLQQFSRHLDSAAFLLCDQPALSRDHLQQLVDRRQATGAGVVAAHYQGHLGAPALLAREHFPTLLQLTGDEGARQLFHRLPPASIVAVDLPELAFDVDRPEDVAALQPTKG